MVCHRYAPFPGGGADRQAQRIAETLAAQGWRMRVLTKLLPGTHQHETLNGVEVRRLWSSELRGLQSVIFTLNLLLRLLRSPRGQVIHLNQMYREILPALLARRLRRSPIVIRIACGGSFGDVARLQTIPAGRQMLKLSRRADAIISLSGQITQELLEQGFARERIVEIPNGVDTRRFCPVSPEEKAGLRTTLKLPQDGRLVIFTGRLHFQKGVDTLLRAWARVQGAQAQVQRKQVQREQAEREQTQAQGQVRPSAHLLLLGEDQEGGKLQQMAADLGVQASVHFLGHVEPVLPYLQASDVFVLPSLFEGLSNALLEGMACGLAVMTTNIGGTCEVIRPEVDGLLFEPGDVERLAHLLGQMLGDSVQREHFGAQARRRVEETYRAELTAERYAALYAQLAGTHPVAARLPGAQLVAAQPVAALELEVNQGGEIHPSRQEEAR
jgi:glycosyltransferase involved in cell wall biosynthesis